MAQGFGSPQGPWQPSPWSQQASFRTAGSQGRPQPIPWPGPSGGPRFPGPQPRPRRGVSPLILIGIGLLGLIMLALVVNSLVNQPDFQNDDYVPPPPGNVRPFPDAPVSEVDNIVLRNALYGQTAPRPVRCDLADPNLNINTASDAAVTAYIDDLMACNMRVWDPPFRGTAEYELVRPAVNVYRESVSTPCGGGERMGPNAVYCAANQEVYWSRELPRFLPRLGQPHAVDMVMAHEFGHGMQARSIILFANAYNQRQTDRREALELSRRLELQADCFAGVWVQSVAESLAYSPAELNNMIEAIKDTGDDRGSRPNPEGDHGQAESRGYWIQLGMSGSDVARCNTFAAPSDFVR